MITSIDKRLKKWHEKYGDLSPEAKSKLKLLLADFAKSSEQKDSSYVRRVMNLRLLPPTLIEDILYGKQDPNLKVADLYKMVKV